MSNRQKVLKASPRHHAWCSFADDPAETCLHCEVLFRDYPFRPGETDDQASTRYFPLPEPKQYVEPEPDLLMVKPGMVIEQIAAEVKAARAKPDRLENVLTGQQIHSDELLSVDYEMSIQRKRTRVAQEIERIEQTQTQKIKLTRTRTDYHIIETDGHKREVRKVKTTASKLEKTGKLPRDLSNYVQLFAHLVANGMGAATDDSHDSTNRLTCSYEPSGGGGFGSKTPSDRVLTGMNAYQMMRQRVPQELLPLFDQIVNEEVAGYSPLARTLVELGEALGYTHRQSTASGGTQVFCVAALIAHFLRENGIYTRKSRHSDAGSDFLLEKA